MAYGRHRHSRAEVRHQLFRARERARRMFRFYWRGVREDEKDETDRKFHRKWLYQFAVDRKPCSCEMCGNRRRWGGPKLSEIRTAERERDEDREIEAEDV